MSPDLGTRRRRSEEGAQERELEIFAREQKRNRIQNFFEFSSSDSSHKGARIQSVLISFITRKRDATEMMQEECTFRIWEMVLERDEFWISSIISRGAESVGRKWKREQFSARARSKEPNVKDGYEMCSWRQTRKCQVLELYFHSLFDTHTKKVDET